MARPKKEKKTRTGWFQEKLARRNRSVSEVSAKQVHFPGTSTYVSMGIVERPKRCDARVSETRNARKSQMRLMSTWVKPDETICGSRTPNEIGTPLIHSICGRKENTCPFRYPHKGEFEEMTFLKEIKGWDCLTGRNYNSLEKMMFLVPLFLFVCTRNVEVLSEKGEQGAKLPAPEEGSKSVPLVSRGMFQIAV